MAGMNRSFKAPPKQWFSDKVSSLGEIKPKLAGRYLVKNLLEPGCVSILYGPSNSGKSLVALDLAMHVAAGHDWHGNKVRGRSGQVLYICSEGVRGFKNRISAVAIWGPELFADAKRKAGFSLFSGAVDFSSAKTVAEIIAQLQVRKLAPDLVVIGTLARNFGQGDENSVRDMVSFISNVERLAEAFGAHVIIVHHTGKDRTKNARGSSALNAAVSTEIKVTNASGKSVVIEVIKQRDLPVGRALSFKIKTVDLGTDEDGENVAAPYIVFEKFGAQGCETTGLRGQPGRALDVLRGLASERVVGTGSAPGRGVIPTLARAEWSLARSSGEVRAGCWAAMDVLR